MQMQMYQQYVEIFLLQSGVVATKSKDGPNQVEKNGST